MSEGSPKDENAFGVSDGWAAKTMPIWVPQTPVSVISGSSKRHRMK
jgi:hypothetical protein